MTFDSGEPRNAATTPWQLSESTGTADVC